MAEYQRGIMDAASDSTVETVVVMSSAQVGKTEAILNTIGYFVDQDPSPMLWLLPTLEMAQAMSKDRLAPMMRDTPALAKLGDGKSRDSGSTMLHKQFPGGHITLAGANSPASLASRPIRVLLADEVDRYPLSAGTEGDPVSLAKKRTTTFWNRKVLLVSTPTVKGKSRIEAAYLESDQRKFYVPCPDCGHAAPLAWANVHWPENKPQDAYYACGECGSVWDDATRWRAIRKGHWVAHAPFKGTAGFHLSELYSPWVKLGETAQTFWDAKDFPERLKTWCNTALGETWETKGGEGLDEEVLAARVEDWSLEDVPEEVRLLTAGVDCQNDRLECTVTGWTPEGHMLVLGHRVFYGQFDEPTTWQSLDDFLKLQFPHRLGGSIGLSAVCIDSGSGLHTPHVLDFCRARLRRRIYPSKGEDGFKRVDVQSSKTQAILKLVGVDVVKEAIFNRLNRLPDDLQSASVRFSDSLDANWFEQLCSEQIVEGRTKGRITRHFAIIGQRRNEALDTVVYAWAARRLVQDPDWDRVRQELSATTPQPKPAPKRRSSEAASWVRPIERSRL